MTTSACTEEGDENIPYDKKWVIFRSWYRTRSHVILSIYSVR
jgi:hypothetical protein